MSVAARGTPVFSSLRPSVMPGGSGLQDVFAHVACACGGGRQERRRDRQRGCGPEEIGRPLLKPMPSVAGTSIRKQETECA